MDAGVEVERQLAPERDESRARDVLRTQPRGVQGQAARRGVEVDPALAPGLPVLRLKNEDFSRDREMVARLNADPLTRNEKQPAATVAALYHRDTTLLKDMPRRPMPILWLLQRGLASRLPMSMGQAQLSNSCESPCR